MSYPPQWKSERQQTDFDDDLRNVIDWNHPVFDALNAEERAEAEARSPFLAFSVVGFLAEDAPAPGFVVDGLFPRGDVTVFAARSGIGKSFLMLQAALCVAAGRPFLGQSVQPGSAQLREDLGRIGDAALLVIDTAKIVFQDSIVDTEAVRYFIADLRALAAGRNVAIVLVTHVNRHGETSGTTEWQNHSRAVVHVKPDADHFRVEVVKTNYVAPIPPLPITRAANGAWTLRTEAGTVPTAPDARPRPKTLAERARQAFLDGLDAIPEPLSAKKNSPNGNYAPKRIARTARAKQLRVGQPALETAMAELLAEGVVVEVPGPGKHKTKILARAKGEV